MGDGGLTGLQVKVLATAAVGFTAGFLALRLWLSSSGPGAVAPGSAGEVQEVAWSTLRELDLGTGKKSSELSALNGALVKIPGFIIPLEDSQLEVSEFLLVPSPMACIHVPPPPANQIVYVKMAPGQRAQMSFGPVWVQGRLRIQESEGFYGKASFDLTGEYTLPYVNSN